MPARVQVINEATEGEEGDWRLCFQWCLYVYEDGTSEHGYRFIWRRPDGRLQPARGQARLPSIKDAEALMAIAKKQRWGHHTANTEKGGSGD